MWVHLWKARWVRWWWRKCWTPAPVSDRKRPCATSPGTPCGTPGPGQGWNITQNIHQHYAECLALGWAEKSHKISTCTMLNARSRAGLKHHTKYPPALCRMPGPGQGWNITQNIHQHNAECLVLGRAEILLKISTCIMLNAWPWVGLKNHTKYPPTLCSMPGPGQRWNITQNIHLHYAECLAQGRAETTQNVHQHNAECLALGRAEVLLKISTSIMQNGGPALGWKITQTSTTLGTTFEVVVMVVVLKSVNTVNPKQSWLLAFYTIHSQFSVYGQTNLAKEKIERKKNWSLQCIQPQMLLHWSERFHYTWQMFK